jgi:hypothetical protein
MPDTRLGNIVSDLSMSMMALDPPANNTPNTQTPGTQGMAQGMKDMYGVDPSQNSQSVQYEGLYVVNSAGKQVELISYKDDLDTPVDFEVYDIDKDGNEDVVYKMNNAVYIKKNIFEGVRSASISSLSGGTLSGESLSGTTNSGNTLPPRPKKDLKAPAKNAIAATPEVWGASRIASFLHMSSIRSIEELRSAPNFFREMMESATQINFGFLPPWMTRDRRYRLEMYDVIHRPDELRMSRDEASGRPTDPSAFSPTSTREIVDFSMEDIPESISRLFTG